MTLQDIEKEFEEKYSGIIKYGYAGYEDKNVGQEVKSFWLSHIHTMMEEMKKGVERKKRNTPHTQVQKDLAGHHIGYNQALSDVLSILNKYCS